MDFIHHYKSVAKSKPYKSVVSPIKKMDSSKQVFVPYTNVVQPKQKQVENYSIRMDNKTTQMISMRPSSHEINLFRRNKITQTNISTDALPITINNLLNESVPISTDALPITINNIPLYIFQAGPLNLTPKMKENIDTFKSRHPEFIHYLYDTNMCRNFIKEHFNKDVVDIFDKLTSVDYKYDLWKYCVLYIHGGIYLDIKYSVMNNFKLNDLISNDFFIKNNIAGIYNALLICMPNNNILYHAIQSMVTRINKNKYTMDESILFGNHIPSFFNTIDTDQLQLSFSDFGSYILYNNTKILQLQDI